MSKVSKETAPEFINFAGIGEDRYAKFDGFTVGFGTALEDSDMADITPDLCECPHWGYMIAGRAVIRYADSEEVYEAGDAFYMAPGHAPAIEKGTEMLMFSPTDQLDASNAMVMKQMLLKNQGD